MRLGPGRTARVDAAMTEQKRQQLLARSPQRLHRAFASAHQLADGFVSNIRDPNRRQFACSMELGQAQRVAPVGLNPIPRALTCTWVLLYIERWLKAPMETQEGTKVARERGTPQGGVVSPLLANLFLHYGAPG